MFPRTANLYYNDLSGSASRPRLNLKVHLLQVAAALSPNPARPSGLKQHSKPRVQGLEIVVAWGRLAAARRSVRSCVFPDVQKMRK